MDSKHLITLPSDLRQRCHEQGRLIVDCYRRGLNARSRAVSSHGAQDNADLQAIAKMGECAFCLWAGLNPLRSLHWGESCDAGYDVRFSDLRIDVKTTKAGNRYLIWPVNKREFMLEKAFEALVIVRGDEPTFEITGWTSKFQFSRLTTRRRTAPRVTFSPMAPSICRFVNCGICAALAVLSKRLCPWGRYHYF
jgi:hypothetical protein